MSHLQERSEKNCLNCNAIVHGKYCHVCGQENLEPQETAWHLVTHFFNDITHFDGKFFSTLKYLVFRPGFLSREYMIGRRASYLNPIRMYVFTSAIFFLIFFSITQEGDLVKSTYNGKTPEQIDKMDSLQFDSFTRKLNDGKAMSRQEFRLFKDTVSRGAGIHFSNGNYKSKADYDSLLRSGEIKDGWFQRTMTYNQIKINEKYHNDQNQILKAFIGNLLHSFPQMLFISLPIFAFILKLLYFRRKNFYYASHAIFSVHLYVFVFIMLLAIIGLQEVHDYLHWRLINYLIALVVFYIFYYQYKSMRNFFQQRRGKTILKYILLNLVMSILIGLLVVVFMFFSLMKI